MAKKPEEWIGIHERLATRELVEALREAGLEDAATWEHKLSRDDLEPALAAHLARLFADLLGSRGLDGGNGWQERLEALDENLRAAGAPFSGMTTRLPSHPFRLLTEVCRPGQRQVGVPATRRPDLPLGVSALLTGSSRTPSLVTQLEKELVSADRADWLVSFIKWSGLRPLRQALEDFTDRPASGHLPRLRVATTTYMGATDAKAVEFLVGLPNTEVRVSYDSQHTRLHAKAYLFHRSTGFGSAYIGSANVSRAALDEGLEWTTRVAQHELPHLWRQALASFETHWEDKEFRPLTPEGLERFNAAVASERAETSNAGSSSIFFDLRPYRFQREILEAIQAERRAGLARHLVVSATGTGKTMVAAFDYRGFSAERPARPSLLYLAHREEILQKSLESFRQVLRDGSFGDLLVGGSKPSQERHLFASVQSWHSRGLEHLSADHFDYVVLDEAHHAAADKYKEILSQLRPQVLLGLTATPERADGKSILSYFREQGGGGDPWFTHEIRLPDAINRQLLVPFHYFGVADEPSIDLSGLKWEAGGYRLSELEGVLGANDARARWVVHQFQNIVTSPSGARALGFCVSQAHAHFMAESFTASGVPAVALTAKTPRAERQKVQSDLVARRINVIFTVDLYNEGVDIPEVDTVLLLRPTESLTVYLQQLGRGLRRHPQKPHLTVLDFIAPQHRRFRFADRFRALTTNHGRSMERQVEDGFPWLPSGCLLKLDRRSSEIVLRNIRESAVSSRPRLLERLRHYWQQASRDTMNRPPLRDLLAWLDMNDADDLLRHGLPSCLLEQAGAPVPGEDLGPKAKAFQRGARTLLTMDDREVLQALADAISGKTADSCLLEMAHSLLWNARGRPPTAEAASDFIRERPRLAWDLKEVLRERLLRPGTGSGVRIPAVRGSLELHCSYTREQVLLAMGRGSFHEPRSHREGVLYVAERKADIFFVTLQKAEARFSPTTMYEDYIVSEDLFHWQSQSTTTADSPTGQRYINHLEQGVTPLLFLRESSRLPSRLTAPFIFLGPLAYVRHEGDKPMSVTWRLLHSMPARILRWSSEAA